MAEQEWQIVPFGWTVQPDGVIRAEMPQGVLLLKDSFSQAGEFRATVVVHRAVQNPTFWKTAGITLWQDDRNSWRLNLVEAPDNLNRQHTVELHEMFNGVWLAGHQPETRLSVDESASFNRPGWTWQFETPYRLRLVWNEQSVRGEVYDAENTLCWRTRWLLDNPKSVRTGYLGLTCNAFDATFSQTEVVSRVAAQPPAATVPPPPRYSVSHRGKKVEQGTGFFQVKRVDGVWWFIDPEGHLFFALGTDHTSYYVHWCEKLGYAPYHENMKRRHGSEEAWARETAERLKAWNFNILAANHSEYLRYRGLPFIQNILGMGQGFAAIDDLVKQVNWTGFPNVFSPRWEQWCDWIAYQRCAPLRDNPWVIGYFLDNELEWFGKDYKQWGLAIEALKRPPNHPARVAMAELLKERYGGDVDRFNRAWNARIRDFEQIATDDQPPAIQTEQAQQDGIAFTRLAAERYFRVCAEAIRRHDPNHLVMGCRFAGEAPPVLDIAGKYCDVITINTYPRIDLRSKRVLDWEERLREYHQQSKRPLMITEWSFPALDSGLPCKHGAGMRVDTQQQRAECFRIFLSALTRLPFMVGSNFFMWVDEPALGISSTFPEDSNYGLVNEQGEPYRELTQMATTLQAKAYEMHNQSAQFWTRSPQPPEPKPPVFTRRRWRVPADTALAWQVDLLNRGDAPFTGWFGVDLPEHPLTRRKGRWQVIGMDGKPARFSVESVHQQRVWIWLQALAPGKRWSALVTFAPERTSRIAQTGAIPPDFRLKARAFDLQFGNERAPIHTIWWDQQRIGSYTVLVQQSLPQMQWVPPNRYEAVQVVNTPFGYYLRGWLVHRDGSAITEVDQQTGVYAPQAVRPQSYRVEWEMEIHEGLLLARLRRLQNLGAKPLRVEAVYHYAQSQLVGDGRQDEPAGVPNYYLNAAAWSHPQVELFYGAMPLDAQKWQCIFWKDEGGGQHPDLWHNVKRVLQPNETITLDGGWVALLIGKGGFGRGDWTKLARHTQSLASISTGVQWIRQG
ncbi:MAG: beta-galactosidase [Chthonomonadetes bacterium]|nr:beta-galactosidase [Chthonomonadetes bacterium]